MKAHEKILELAKKAEDHASKAGLCAMDLDIRARTMAMKLPGTARATDSPSNMVLGALAHAHAAEAYRNAAEAYSALSHDSEVDAGAVP